MQCAETPSGTATVASFKTPGDGYSYLTPIASSSKRGDRPGMRLKVVDLSIDLRELCRIARQHRHRLIKHTLDLDQGYCVGAGNADANAVPIVARLVDAWPAQVRSLPRWQTSLTTNLNKILLQRFRHHVQNSCLSLEIPYAPAIRCRDSPPVAISAPGSAFN